jgi:hypothetical protein
MRTTSRDMSSPEMELSDTAADEMFPWIWTMYSDIHEVIMVSDNTCSKRTCRW